MKHASDRRAFLRLATFGSAVALLGARATR